MTAPLPSKSYIGEVNRDCEVCRRLLLSVPACVVQGIINLYRLRCTTRIDQARPACTRVLTLTGRARVVKHDNNYHIDEIAIMTDH